MRMPLALMLGLGGILGGCGYQQAGNYDSPTVAGYHWHSLYREDIRTVAVPIFTNKDFHRGLEFSLSKAVISALEAHTPYKVVSRDRADTILEGEISNVKVLSLSFDPKSALPQEQLMTLSINFVWKDLRTGRILVERKDFEQSTTYYPTLGESSSVGSQLAVERLALGIVQELQAEW